MKSQTKLILAGIFVLMFIGILVLLPKQTPNEGNAILDDATILFYGDGCPHCEEVEKFIEENDVENKMSFTRLEVWNNIENASVLDDALAVCDIDPATAGVPLLFVRGECFVGGPDVEDALKNEAGL